MNTPALSMAATVLLPGLGIALYLLFHHVVMWLGKRDDRLVGLCALWFLGASILLCTMFHDRASLDPRTTVTSARVVVALSYAFGILIADLAHALAETQHGKHTWRGLIVFNSLSMVLVLGTPLYIQDNVYERVEPFGIRYFAVTGGPMVTLGGLYGLCLLVWAVWHVARNGKMERTDRITLAIGVVVTLAITVNDTLQLAQVIETVRMSDYGTLALGIGLAAVIARRYSRLRARLQDLVEEQTRALKQTNATNARLAAALRHADDAVGICDMTGTLSYANSALERLRSLHPDPIGEALTLFRRHRDPLGAAWRGRMELGPRIFEATVSPLIDDELLFVAVLRDITEQQRLHAALITQDRLASLGTLAAGVGHEINNPLAFIMNNLATLHRVLPPLVAREDAPDAKDVLEVLDEVRTGAERIRVIVRDLKAFTRADEEARAALDVHAVARAAIKMTAVQTRHSSRVVEDLGPLPRVMGNEARLCQVLTNLLVNAAQAIPHGRQGTVTVRARTGENGWAVLDVEDNGGGIAPEHLDKVLNPFFTTKPVGEGTGLGLSISNAIVQDMGGKMVVRSTVNVGTTVTVTFPPAPSAAPETREETPGARAAAVRRVLVVDDDPLFARSVKRLLHDRDVTVALGGSEALRMLEEDSRYDVILCDLMMPELDGAECYALIARRFPQVVRCVVLMTGGAVTPSAQEFLDGVQNPRLEKPFGREELLAVLESAHGTSSRVA